MPKRGIHPLMHQVTIVLRNGATFQIETCMKAARPVRLQIDTTSNPRWTGEKATLSSQDGRAAQFLRKFDFGGAQGAKVEK